MAYAAGIQAYIYSNSPYYDHPTGHKNDVSARLDCPCLYLGLLFLKSLLSITGLEYAYRKAPEKMKYSVMAALLFIHCFGSINGFALITVAVNPKLLYMYTSVACAMAVYAHFVPLFVMITTTRRMCKKIRLGRSNRS